MVKPLLVKEHRSESHGEWGSLRSQREQSRDQEIKEEVMLHGSGFL